MNRSKNIIILSLLLILGFATSYAFAGPDATVIEAQHAAIETAEEVPVEQHIKFVIDHADSSKGLVEGSFGKFEVTKATLNLEKIEESTVEISVDVSSIDTGIKPRDKHLNSPDFFDTAQFSTATIAVKGAKAGEGDVYTAAATFALHGVTKEFPVSFKIIERRKDGSIVIEGDVEVNRKDYGVGLGKSASGSADVAKVSLKLHIPASK